ncbi:MAG: 16S rRNA (guanine(527)-N(7))-methyltransferase RsmG [Clostridia bacterium]|nr:16S rRNA (guanine(527)-N(7))-methyltransferase RsmG [Clostridia bacterium]
MSIIPILKDGFNRLDIAMSGAQLEMLETYCARLIEYNQKVNLTAITEPEEIARKHFLDCAACQHLIPGGAKCADIGTGAGFPGMVLAIVRPDVNMTLFDSLNKRLNFLRELAQELSVRAECVHARAEDAGQDPLYRQKYDVALSRAVARLPLLCEYTLPFVRVGGCLLALKGPEVEGELKDAQRAISILGGAKPIVEQSDAFDSQQHNFVLIKKIKGTPPQYPRKAGMPAKNPLV